MGDTKVVCDLCTVDHMTNFTCHAISIYLTRHMKRFLLVGCCLLLLQPTLAWAADESAVWRVEISDYREPLQSAPDSFWTQLRRWLPGRTVRQRPPVGTSFVVNTSAYASSPYQTDSSPCITAAGTRVRPGVVATNFLPFGTLLWITADGERAQSAEAEPLSTELYIVEDRMNSRYQGRYVDIWFPSTSSALEHGRRRLFAEVIGYGTPGQDVRGVAPHAAASEAEEQVVAVAEPSLARQVGLRVSSLTRSLSRFLQTNVNQYDVNCFVDDPA